MKDKALTKEEIDALNFSVKEGLLDESQLEEFLENPYAARQWLDSENEPDLAEEHE